MDPSPVLRDGACGHSHLRAGVRVRRVDAVPRRLDMMCVTCTEYTVHNVQQVAGKYWVQSTRLEAAQ